MIGNLDVQRTFTLQEVCSMSNKLISGLEEYSQQGAEFSGFGFPDVAGHDTKNALSERSTMQLAFEMLMESSGYKNMRIQVCDFQLRAVLGPLLKLAGLASMDASVDAPPPRQQPPPELQDYL